MWGHNLQKFFRIFFSIFLRILAAKYILKFEDAVVAQLHHFFVPYLHNMLIDQWQPSIYDFEIMFRTKKTNQILSDGEHVGAQLTKIFEFSF